MAKQFEIRTFTNRRLDPKSSKDWGKISIIEELKDLPFDIKRIFYIYETAVGVIRGGHRLKKCLQAAICVSGSYEIFIDDGEKHESIILDDPKHGVIFDKKDWHTLTPLKEGSVLLVLCSELYDPDEYIDEPYETTPREIVEQVYPSKK